MTSFGRALGELKLTCAFREPFRFSSSTPFVEPTTSDTSYSPPLQQTSSASTAESVSDHRFGLVFKINSILEIANSGYRLLEVYPQNSSAESIVKFKAAKKDSEEEFNGFFISPNEDGEYVGVPSNFAKTFTRIYEAQAQRPNHLKCFPRIILLQTKTNGTCLVLFEKTRPLIDKFEAVSAITKINDELGWLGLVPDSYLDADNIFVTNLGNDKIYIDLLSVSLRPYRTLVDVSLFAVLNWGCLTLPSDKVNIKDHINYTFIVLQLVCFFVTGEKFPNMFVSQFNLGRFDTNLKKKLKDNGVSTSNVELLENLFKNISQDPPEIHTLAEPKAELQSLSVSSSIQKVLSRVKITNADTIFSNEFLNIQILAIECKQIELPWFEFSASSIEDAVRRIKEIFSIDNSKYQEKKENVSIGLPFASVEEAVVYTLEKYTIFNISIVKNGATIATTFAGKVNKRGFSGPYALALPLLWCFSFLNVSTDVRIYLRKNKYVAQYSSNPRLKDPCMAWCVGKPPKAYLNKFSNIAHQLRHEDKVIKSTRWVRMDYLDAFYDFVQRKKRELAARGNQGSKK
ncbi:hypothetical protein BKA69DRAFT_1169230 [Paraphysoderma sedebokerense]|nr:hypothetical protein BKA69DRAFT_1169230 [Paraphysoderma sedebokerense]